MMQPKDDEVSDCNILYKVWTELTFARELDWEEVVEESPSYLVALTISLAGILRALPQIVTNVDMSEEGLAALLMDHSGK